MAGPHTWIAQTPSSWVAGSFDTGLLPASNEVVVFNGRGNGDVVGGFNQAAIDLDRLDIDADYEGNIGAAGNPLIISADEVFYSGSGSMWYKDGNGTTDLMIVDSPNLIDAVNLSGATITRLRILDGKTNILPDFTGLIAKLEIAGSSEFGGNVNVLSGSSCDVTKLWMTGGSLVANDNQILAGATISALIAGGSCQLYYGIEFTGDFIIDGGTVTWTGFDTGANAWNGDLHLISGTLDARRNGAKTIANLYKWEGANLLYRQGQMTITNEYRMKTE